MSATTIATANPSQSRAFAAVLRRDLYVTGKELPVFLAQVILQPLFLLFVFGKVLGSLGYTQHGYAHLLFPGLLALTAVITGMQTLAFPLVVEFGWTKEIEDRLLAPMSTALTHAAICGTLGTSAARIASLTYVNEREHDVDPLRDDERAHHESQAGAEQGTEHEREHEQRDPAPAPRDRSEDEDPDRDHDRGGGDRPERREQDLLGRHHASWC